MYWVCFRTPNEYFNNTTKFCAAQRCRRWQVNLYRRSLIATAGAATVAPLFNAWGSEQRQSKAQQDTLVLTSFISGYVMPGTAWRGFSDRVMGGISSANLEQDTVADKKCARLTGTVTRESNGGFIQMALYFGDDEAELDGSAYSGIELLVYGNNEDYNVHIRTADCGWYDESYRHTFFAKPEWQSVRIPFSQFEANSVKAPLDSAHINRLAILGWMREFQADIALARISLYS
jgi:hypothetical protein